MGFCHLLRNKRRLGETGEGREGLELPDRNTHKPGGSERRGTKDVNAKGEEARQGSFKKGSNGVISAPLSTRGFILKRGKDGGVAYIWAKVSRPILGLEGQRTPFPGRLFLVRVGKRGGVCAKPFRSLDSYS